MTELVVEPVASGETSNTLRISGKLFKLDKSSEGDEI